MSPRRIFLAGATGILGRRALPRLVAAGHDVVAVARTDDKADLVQALGGRPVAVSLFDPEGLTTAMAGCDTVVNLATHVPPLHRMADPTAWAEHDRLRIEGSAALVDAAVAAGVDTYVQESIAFGGVGDGDRWIDETAALADGLARAGIEGAEASTARFAAAGDRRRGIALRFGLFHAPEAASTRAALHLAAHGVAFAVGAADAHQPIVHVDDAADAVVAALDAPSGTYHVVDDESPTRARYAEALAAAIGARRLRLPPPLVSRALARRSGEHLVASQRASNGRFREATGWAPAHPSATETWAGLAQETGTTDRVGALGATAGLLVLLVGALLVGGWALLAPTSFHADFPGFGRSWVAPDGPYNEHLVRDVGALNLALAAVTAWALVTMRRPLVQAAAVLALVWGVPHLGYHLGHLGGYPTGDAVGIALSLTVPLIAAAGVLVAARRQR